jgi:hypothetical protein
MMRLLLRAGTILTLALVLIAPVFAHSPAKRKHLKSANGDDAVATSTANAGPETSPALTAEPAPAPGEPSPAAQSAGTKKSSSDPSDSKPNPKFLPMLATTGTIGMFTVETADTLPKGGFAFSAYGNKFGRAPGSVTIFQLGLDLSYGLTNRINLYGSFQPYQHAHIGNGSQLSLSPVNSLNPLYPNTIFPTLPFTGTPGFVEDYPFAAQNGGGLGYITLGVKFGILSERLGDPFSFSIRNDLNIASHTSLPRLIANGTLGSPYSDQISLAVSKNWSDTVITSFNVGDVLTTNPSNYYGQNAFLMPAEPLSAHERVLRGHFQ